MLERSSGGRNERKCNHQNYCYNIDYYYTFFVYFNEHFLIEVIDGVEKKSVVIECGKRRSVVK